MSLPAYDDDADLQGDDEPIEAYCVTCRQKVEIQSPVPVWTRRGTPGTRGECPICGTVVFRMGRTDAHQRLSRPESGQKIGKTAPALQRPGRTRYTAYVACSRADAVFAARLAEDLSRTGIPVWIDPESETRDKSQWASGVHPALQECSHMVVVLSPAALTTGDVQESWRFFRDHRKPVLVAQVQACEVPDALRRQPRFDFGMDYKNAFRMLVQALAG